MPDAPDILILGCGYTGERVARRFLAAGARVTAAARHPEKLSALGTNNIALTQLNRHVRAGMLVLHSIPPSGPMDLLAPLRGKARRIVYLSSTAVYGSATAVDERTPADAGTERARLRLQAEREVSEGPWSWLILRPAAIYGPGRGVQESIQRGEHSLSDRLVSRIHVDDLALHVEQGLLSSVTGAYPVADEDPCTSREIGEFCARLLGLPPAGVSPSAGSRTPRFANNRRVDGSAIRRALGISLAYPSYRAGVPATLGRS